MRLDWLRRAISPPVEPASAEKASDGLVAFAEPEALLVPHREKLNALRLESGYHPEQFDRLIQAAIRAVASYVQHLPASRSENHRELGGLLRLALETALIAFRRADGKFFAGFVRSDARNRDRDRAWRYAAFLAGLCRPLSAPILRLRVEGAPEPLRWNPYSAGLSDWASTDHLRGYRFHWQPRAEAPSVEGLGVFLASRVLPPGLFDELYRGDPRALESLIDALSGHGRGALRDLIEEGYQAAIERDLTAAGHREGQSVAGVRVEHRLLDALRGLVRDKWTINQPGSRLWSDGEHVHLVWRPAVNDISVRLRAHGIAGVPSDPDTIAELLVETEILAVNDASASLPHYFKIVPDTHQVPRQPLDVVRLTDPNLIGVRIDAVDPVALEVVGATRVQAGGQGSQASLPLTETAAAVEVETAEEAEDVSEVPRGPAAPARAAADEQELERLKRYGPAGEVLRELAEQLRESGDPGAVFLHADGVAMRFPDAIQAFCDRPDEFLSACRAQNLIVTDKRHPAQCVRTRPQREGGQREQFVVFSPRIGRILWPEAFDE